MIKKIKKPKTASSRSAKNDRKVIKEEYEFLAILHPDPATVKAVLKKFMAGNRPN